MLEGYKDELACMDFYNSKSRAESAKNSWDGSKATMTKLEGSRYYREASWAAAEEKEYSKWFGNIYFAEQEEVGEL